MKLFIVALTVAFNVAFNVTFGLAVASFSTAVVAQSGTSPDAPKKTRAERAAELRAERAAKKTAAPPPVADEDQMRATERVLFGEYECEFNQRLQVKLDPKYPGYANVTGVGVNFLMKPVASSTGAIRLEDVKNVGLLLQVAGKSMLMNVKTGQRVMDSCVHPDQVGTVKN
jgi:hypothetical protein